MMLRKLVVNNLNMKGNHLIRSIAGGGVNYDKSKHQMSRAKVDPPFQPSKNVP